MALTERQEIAIRLDLPGVPSGFEHTPAAGKPAAPDSAVAFTADAGTNLITSTAHGLMAGTPVRFTSTTTLPAGLVVAATYYVIPSGLTADAFKVSAALAGSEVDITDAGTGTHSWQRYLTASEQEELAIFLAYVTNGRGRLPGVVSPNVALITAAFAAYYQSAAYKTWWNDNEESRAAQYRLRQADTVVANDATVPISGDPGGGGSDPPLSPIERYGP